jgi:hypothetical protein
MHRMALTVQYGGEVKIVGVDTGGLCRSVFFIHAQPFRGLGYWAAGYLSRDGPDGLFCSGFKKLSRKKLSKVLGMKI